MNEYEQIAKDFLIKTGTKFNVTYLEHGKYFEDDKESRDIWKITLRRNNKSFSFKYGQSIMNVGETPTPYDVLACLTKSNPGTFEDFCSEYGYDMDSIKATKTYKAVVKEFKGVERLFSDVLGLLEEIQ